MNQRKVTHIVRGQRAIDGAGVHLQRVLGHDTVTTFDPFLMLDGFDSTDPQDYIKGFPWHPHRGIETISYLVSGSMEHRDSIGNVGVVSDQGCQWMTAGAGIIHQEMPQPSAHMLGCQLWLNLPAAHKMVPPAYGSIEAASIPVLQQGDATIRIVSGSYQGHPGAFEGQYIKTDFIDVTLAPHTQWRYAEATNDKTVMLYLLQGTLAPDDQQADYEQKGCAMRFAPTNNDPQTQEEVLLYAGETGARFILLAARPLHEPISWGGPIVMNTREELETAMHELRTDTFIKEV